MKMKRLLSSLTAAALILTVSVGELPVLSGAGAVAYAVATEQYIYTHSGSSLSATVKEKNDGTYECTYSEDIAIPGVTYGTTTVAQLMELYTGITAEGFSFANSSVEGLTADDISLSVSVLSGESWDGWDASDNSAVLDFANVNSANYDKIVRATTFHVIVKAEAIERLGLASGDTVVFNLPEDASFFECAYNGSPVTVKMGDAGNGAFWGSGEHYFGLDGAALGEVTFGELKQLADGIKVTDWEYNECTLEELDVADLSYSVLLVCGDNSEWKTATGTTVMFSDFTDIADDVVVHGVGLQLSLYDGSGKYGFSAGDLFVVNPKPWVADFEYAELTGYLTWKNVTTTSDEKITYDVYANETKLGNATSTVTNGYRAAPWYMAAVDLAAYDLYRLETAPALTGEVVFTVSADGFGTAEGSYTMSYDGCDESALVSTPTNVALDENGNIIWTTVTDAVGYIFRAYGENITPYSNKGHGNENTGDIGMAKLCMSGNGVEDCAVEIYAVDINGDVSKPFTALYSELSERKDYNIHFDENGMLCWDEAEGAESYILMMSDPAGMYVATDRCGTNNSANYLSIMQSEGFVDGTYIFNVYSVDADGNETFLGLIKYEYTAPSETVGENVFYYTDNGNGTATITGGVINDGDVVIPSEVAGLDVTEVGMNAFDFEANIETLVISEGIERLGWYAFNTCENLTSVTLPESLEYIDSWAFERCYKLSTINVPANVSTVKGGAFAQNKSMTSITCDPANKNYVSVDGVLFTKDMDALVAYPAGITGAYTVPATVNHIGDAAFYGAKGLESVTILGQLDFIGFEAFAECEKLTDVKINEGVNYVGYWAFRNCTGIKLLTVPQSVTNIGDEAFGYGSGEKLADFTLRGYKDSAVYYYAIRHDIPFICIGEADAENMPFDDKNAVEEEVDFNPATPEEDRITSIVYKPGFNMKDKSEAGVGLDLSLIKVKANEVYDEEGLARAEAALGTEIVGKTHYNLLDITLMYGEKDYSKGYDGLVEVQIPIPPGHQDEEFYCYRILDDGTKEIIPGKRFEEHYSIYLEHFSVYALVAEEEHTCEYSDNWTNDAKEHWHECSCGAKSETAAHTASEWIVDSEDADMKYKECTVCGYIMETADAGAEGEAPASGYSAESASIPTGETVIHKTATVDGVYSQRFVEKVAVADLESAEKVVFTVTNGTKTAVYESNKCYNSLNVNGGAVSAGEGYVFLCLTIKDIPEDITVSIKSVEIK